MENYCGYVEVFSLFRPLQAPPGCYWERISQTPSHRPPGTPHRISGDSQWTRPRPFNVRPLSLQALLHKLCHTRSEVNTVCLIQCHGAVTRSIAWFFFFFPSDRLKWSCTSPRLSPHQVALLFWLCRQRITERGKEGRAGEWINHLRHQLLNVNCRSLESPLWTPSPSL